jgi:hypothetical protein
VPHIPDYVKKGLVWEPAAGRGDITRVLSDAGFDVINSDIDTSNFDRDLGSITCQNFLDVDHIDVVTGESNVTAIITNPPYGGKATFDGVSVSLAEAFVRMSMYAGVPFIAMLLRSEFNHGARRKDLFTDIDRYFSKEIVLTSRPRWDWWYEKDPWEKSNAPMHNFSWFIWDSRNSSLPTQVWMGKKDVGDNEDNGDSDEENV